MPSASPGQAGNGKVGEVRKLQESSAPPCIVLAMDWHLFTVRRGPSVYVHVCLYLGKGTDGKKEGKRISFGVYKLHLKSDF